MNVDVENIGSNKQLRGTNILSDWKFIFWSKKIFQTNIEEQCRNDPNEPQNVPYEIKEALKKGYVPDVVCTSGYDSPKGVL